jgi:hypothetical protein
MVSWSSSEFLSSFDGLVMGENSGRGTATDDSVFCAEELPEEPFSKDTLASEEDILLMVFRRRGT